MARSLLHTFADSKHFEDRRGKAYAQPITERINVKYTFIFNAEYPLMQYLTIIATLTTGCVLLLS